MQPLKLHRSGTNTLIELQGWVEPAFATSAKRGGNAAILDMNEDLGAELEAELGSSAKFWRCDVTDTDNIAEVVRATVDWIKTTRKPLGGIIPAAGTGLPGLVRMPWFAYSLASRLRKKTKADARSQILDKKGEPLSIQSIDFVLSINVRGTLDLTRQLLPHLAAVDPSGPDGERGVIIMIASAAAFEGQMGQVAYAASKGAVASMTLPMARDLSRLGIRVVTLAPSMFESGMTAVLSDKVKKSLERAMEFPLRPGKPEEFSSVVLSAIENVMLNGVVIRLDGATRMPARL